VVPSLPAIVQIADATSRAQARDHPCAPARLWITQTTWAFRASIRSVVVEPAARPGWLLLTFEPGDRYHGR